jgi:HlyD family secretion protein
VVKVGQPVDFKVDAFPTEKFKGKVTQVRNAPREQMNVVVYQTIIEVSNPELKLKPGMTATVSIIVASRDSTLKVPNAALRFKPPKTAVVLEASPSGPSGPSGSSDPSLAAAASSSTSSNSAHSGHVHVHGTHTGHGSSEGDGASAKASLRRRASRTVYVLASNTATNQVPALRAVEIKSGITDGRDTEVTEGLREGDRVVTRVAKAERETHAFNPFALNRQ